MLLGLYLDAARRHVDAKSEESKMRTIARTWAIASVLLVTPVLIVAAAPSSQRVVDDYCCTFRECEGGPNTCGGPAIGPNGNYVQCYRGGAEPCESVT